jgi:polar amino acid transport system substrate-binding protein
VDNRRTARISRRGLAKIALGGTAAAALGSACSRTDNGGLLEQAQDGGTIRVAFAQEPPYAYQDGDGNVTGQSVAMHTYLFEQLGISADQLEWRRTEWGSLITGLGTNHDIVIAGMYVTPDRCQQVAFADPDYVMPDALLVPAGNPDGLTTLNAAADDDDTVIGVMNGTSEQEVADAIYPEDRINVQANLDSLILELKSGRCDAIALTSANLQLAADADADLDITEPFWLIDPETGEEIIGAGAAVFQPSDADFRDALNEQLHPVLDDPQLWEGLIAEWGFTIENNHPEGLTAEELCGGNYQ